MCQVSRWTHAYLKAKFSVILIILSIHSLNTQFPSFVPWPGERQMESFCYPIDPWRIGLKKQVFKLVEKYFWVR